MLRLSIREYGRINREELGQKLVRDLQRFDEAHALKAGQLIFDWGYLNEIRAKNFVGVLQIPGLTIEILPKIDGLSGTELFADDDVQVRHNLLYMLSVSGHFTLFERDLASQAVQRFSILESLIFVFARRLLVELRRGQQHLYVSRVENLSCVKGKIFLQKHCTVNAAHLHRMFVTYDEFESDTWLNRILKAACLKLHSMTRMSQTAQLLREALLEFADVDLQVIRSHHFDLVSMDRNAERFRELLAFCRLIFDEISPAAHAGQISTFSLLFPMESVFEAFVGAVIKKNAVEFGYSSSNVHLQAAGSAKWLLREQNGTRRFRLKPDVLIENEDGTTAIIIDTKWKRLVKDDVEAMNGLSQSDIYQLYAYSHRFQCKQNVLLFPDIPGVTSRTYCLEGDSSQTALKVATIKLNYDLRKEMARLVENLKQVMAFPLPSKSPLRADS